MFLQLIENWTSDYRSATLDACAACFKERRNQYHPYLNINLTIFVLFIVRNASRRVNALLRLGRIRDNHLCRDFNAGYGELLTFL